MEHWDPQSEDLPGPLLSAISALASLAPDILALQQNLEHDGLYASYRTRDLAAPFSDLVHQAKLLLNFPSCRETSE